MAKRGPAYQGWVNYESWAVALWIDNDRGLYEMAREMAAEKLAKTGRKKDAVYAVADSLKEFFDDNMPELEGVWADLLRSALDDVDWDEIAKHYLED